MQQNHTACYYNKNEKEIPNVAKSLLIFFKIWLKIAMHKKRMFMRCFHAETQYFPCIIPRGMLN